MRMAVDNHGGSVTSFLMDKTVRKRLTELFSIKEI
jgi:hypothetical protein